MKRRKYNSHHIYKSIFLAQRKKMRFEIGEKLKGYEPTNDDWVLESIIAHGYIVKKKEVNK